MKFNGNNIFYGKNVKVGKNVRIGDNTTIYDNVIIGNNTTIANNSIIGEPLNDYYSNEDYVNPPTVIGDNSLIRSHNIIYADSQFGDNLSTGHFVSIREKTIVGNSCSIGTKVDIQGYCKLGNYCRLHSNIQMAEGSELGNFVFIYPFVSFTNDPKPPSNDLMGVFIDDYTQVASSVVLLSGVKLGKHSLVGAQSLVKKSYNDYSFISGNPAKFISDIRRLPLFSNNTKHYPWPYNFDRCMPWEGIEYEKWLKENMDDEIS